MNRRREQDEHKALLAATEKLVATMDAKPTDAETPPTESPSDKDASALVVSQA